MNEVEREAMANFDTYEYCKKFIKENFEPVEDKPGYVWYDKRKFQIISIETYAKALEEGHARGLYDLPFRRK